MSAFDQLWRIMAFGSDRQDRSRVEWWYDNNGRLPENDCCLQFVIEGSVKFRYGSDYFIVPSGSAFFFHHGQDSAYGIDDDTTQCCACEFITFSGIGLAEHFALLAAEYGPVIGQSQAAQLLSLSRNLRDRHSQHLNADANVSVPEVYLFMGSLFSILERAKDGDRKPVDKAIHRVITNPLYPWSIKEVVREMGCSREHFTRVFCERFGSSPAEWLNEQRVKHALHLLRHSSDNLDTVAQRAGFSSTHTMSRLIKQETGHSPSSIRQTN